MYFEWKYINSALRINRLYLIFIIFSPITFKTDRKFYTGQVRGRYEGKKWPRPLKHFYERTRSNSARAKAVYYKSLFLQRADKKIARQMKLIRIRVQLRFKRIAIAAPHAIIVLNICARRKVDRVIIISTISNSSIIVLIDLYCIRFYIFTCVLEKFIDEISVGEFSTFFFYT